MRHWIFHTKIPFRRCFSIVPGSGFAQQLLLEDEERFNLFQFLQSHATRNPAETRKRLKAFPFESTRLTKPELRRTFKAMVHCNMVDSAIDLLKQEKAGETLNGMLSFLASTNRGFLVMKVFAESQKLNLPLDVIAYTLALGTYARGTKLHGQVGYKLFDEMLEKGIEPTYITYFSLVLIGANLENWELIDGILNRCCSIPKSEEYSVYARSIIDCGKAQKGEYSFKIFERLLERGITPSLKLCALTIGACGQSGKVKEAEWIYDTWIVERGISPTIFVYANMISAYCHAYQVDKARALFETMHRSGIKPNSVVYNALLYGYALERRADDAIQLFNDMVSAGDSIAYNTMISACGRSGDWKKAEEYFNCLPIPYSEMRNGRPFRRCKISFENMIETYVICGQYQKAIDQWCDDTTCRRRTKTWKALHLLLRACRELGDFETGLSILREFQGRGVQVRGTMYNYLLAILVDRGDVIEAMQLFEEYSHYQANRNVLTYTMILELLVKDQNHHLLVIDLYRAFLTEKISPHTSSVVFMLVIESCIQNGEYQQVVEVFQYISAQAAEEHFCQDVQRWILRHVIIAYEHLGQWQGAVELYDHMQSSDIGHDREAYEATIRAVAQAGAYETALEHNNGDWYRTERTSEKW